VNDPLGVLLLGFASNHELIVEFQLSFLVVPEGIQPEQLKDSLLFKDNLPVFHGPKWGV